MSKHVAVLMGGWSAEREVSLRSGNACADALERGGGYRVSRVDVTRDIALTLRELKPDVALNLLHGRPGEDGTLQGLLEIVGVPYSHSGVLASAVAMQKDIAKTVLKAAGVPVPGGMVAARRDAAREHLLPRPYVIKPLAEGSSVGVFIVRADHAHPPQELTRADWKFGEQVLVEPFIPGKELTCAVLGDKPLGVIEIVSATKFYDYEAKYAPGGSTASVAGAGLARSLRGMPAACARRPPRARLPRRHPRRFPLRRQPRGLAGSRLPGGQHPARHDGNLAGARARRPRRHPVRATGRLDGRGRLARAVRLIPDPLASGSIKAADLGAATFPLPLRAALSTAAAGLRRVPCARGRRPLPPKGRRA